MTFVVSSVTLANVASDFLQNFGNAVRRLRQERGMTQAELADRLGLGRTSVTNLEKGQQNPPLSLLPEIASALGVDLLHLVAVATGAGDNQVAQALAAKVSDENLRRWAGQVIGEPKASHSAETALQQPRTGQSS